MLPRFHNILAEVGVMACRRFIWSAFKGFIESMKTACM